MSFPPLRHSGEGRNPGRALAGCWMNSSVSRFAPDVLSCHSRCARMYSLNHWIPACAGMTAGWIPASAGRLWASLAACSRPACSRQAPLYHCRPDSPTCPGSRVASLLSKSGSLRQRSRSLEGRRLEVISLADKIPDMNVGLAWARNTERSPASSAFCEFMHLAIGPAHSNEPGWA